MLAAMEDLLDSWPGTLIVVSHDRYLLERITDQQYAVMNGSLRHVPGGVDEYLELRRRQLTDEPAREAPTGGQPRGAEAHATRKELAATERRLDKLSGQVARLHEQMAAHDPGDFEGLQRLTDRLRAVEDETASLEEHWLELSEQVG